MERTSNTLGLDFDQLKTEDDVAQATPDDAPDAVTKERKPPVKYTNPDRHLTGGEQKVRRPYLFQDIPDVLRVAEAQ